jgi:SAM-dependent methyltransferase
VAVAGRPEDTWSEAAAYEESFAPLCAGAVPALLDALGVVSPASSLLDVGTGPGTVAAAALARGWAVTAVDPSPAMLERAAQNAPGAALIEGSLPDLPLPEAAFSAAVANFVVNHLPDPRAGLRGLARVVRPGGTVAVTIWASQVSAMNRLWNAVMAEAGAVPPPGMRLPPERDFPRTEDGLARLLAEAGLADVHATTVGWTWRVERERLWRGVEAGLATVGLTYRRQDGSGRAAMRAAYERLAAGLEHDGLLELPSEAVLAAGRRA